MANYEKIRRLAHDAGEYPELDKLVDVCTAEVVDTLQHWHKRDAYRVVRDVLVGLTLADLRGFISSGDEHEWAAAARLAHERALKS